MFIRNTIRELFKSFKNKTPKHQHPLKEKELTRNQILLTVSLQSATNTLFILETSRRYN